MSDSSAAEQAIQTLTAQWYNAICTGCNLDPTTFQLVQGSLPLQTNTTGTTQVWQIFNAVPPQSINQYYSASQGNLFSQAYFAIIDALSAPPQAQTFQSALGPNLQAWQRYYEKQFPSTYSPGAYCQMFQSWAMANRICLPLEVMNDRRAIAKHLLEGIEC